MIYCKKCPYFRDGQCSDTEEFTSYRDGEPCCRFHVDAVRTSPPPDSRLKVAALESALAEEREKVRRLKEELIRIRDIVCPEDSESIEQALPETEKEKP